MTSQQRMFPARAWYARPWVPHTWGGLREDTATHEAFVQCAVCELWLDAEGWFDSCSGTPR
jgi:hypothetical protein